MSGRSTPWRSLKFGESRSMIFNGCPLIRSKTDLESGAAFCDELSGLVAQLGFREGDRLAAMTNPAFADEDAPIVAPTERVLGLPGDLLRPGFAMRQPNGMPAQRIEHRGKKAAEHAPASIDEIFARKVGGADVPALRIGFEHALA